MNHSMAKAMNATTTTQEGNNSKERVAEGDADSDIEQQNATEMEEAGLQNAAKPNAPQYYYFNYQQNIPQKTTGATGASEQKTVDLLVIGGGPASLGLLVNAVKTNRLNELLQGEGMAIVDAGINFGGGILGRYGINSNTSGGGFLKCTYKKTKKDKEKGSQERQPEKTGVNDAKQAQLDQLLNKKKQRASAPNANKTQQKRHNEPVHPYVQQLAITTKKDEFNNEILGPYRDLSVSNISRVLKEFGKNTAPLAVIGHYLNYAGNHLLSFIHTTLKKKIFYPLHKVVSIQLMSNGEILTKVKRQQLEIAVIDNHETIKIIETDQVVMFRSRAVVIANGGVQGLHPDLFNWFPSISPERVIASDEFLRRDGYLKHINNLYSSRTKKVVIIGGSHSGFSCAWMLLNGPSTYYNNNAGIQIDQEPSAQRKAIRNCLDCCQCGAVLTNLRRNGGKQMAQGPNNQALNSVISPNKGLGAAQNQGQLPPPLCNCICICFGLFDYDDWKFDFSKLPAFQDGDVEILYREQIKVFYNKVSDAEKDGYNQFEADKFTKKDGYLYSFSGLRGDAKDLYQKIMRGQEKRVKLVQARTVDEQRQYVDRADLVIWACGYQTNIIPIKDTDRKRIQLSQKVPNTQYDVDGKCRIMLADGHVLTKTLACGIAYPVRTKDGMMATNPTIQNPRADGFSLYMNFVGDTILKNLLPKSKMIKNSIHKIMPKTQSIADAPPPQGDQSQFSKKQYQQVLKARIQQYRQKNNDGLPNQVSNADQAEPIRCKSKGHVNARGHQSSSEERQSEDAYNEDQDVMHDIECVTKDMRVVKATRMSGDPDSQKAITSEDEQALERKMSLHQQNIQQIMIQQRATKSMDRGGFIVGNPSQLPAFVGQMKNMARSPQILQRKDQIIKISAVSKPGGNEDIALVMSPECNSQQILAVSKQPKHKKKQPQVQSSKSPYNNAKGHFTKVIASSGNQQEGSGSAQIMKSYGVGREILRSSHGANRKLDILFGKAEQNPGGGSFKMGRASQVTFNHNNRNLKGYLDGDHGAQYNSQGQDPHQQSFRQQDKTIELPPIVHPLAQNHYVYPEQANIERQSHLNSIGNKSRIQRQTMQQDESKVAQLSKNIQNFKSQNAVGLPFHTFDAKSNIRSSSIYQLQSSFHQDPLLSPMISIDPKRGYVQDSTDCRDPRPLSDNQREPSFKMDRNPLEDEDDLNVQVLLQLQASHKSAQLAKKLKTDSPKKRIIVMPKKSLGVEEQQNPPKQKPVQNINIDDDQDLNDRQSARFGGGERLFAEQSPSPYENECFEAADLQDDCGDDRNHHHLDSQEGDHDGVDEDVSSEGSYRTSQYHRSQTEEKSDEQSSSKNIKTLVQQLSSSQKSKHSHKEDSKTGIDSQHITQSDKSGDQNSKFSFQSRIPRLTKPIKQGGGDTTSDEVVQYKGGSKAQSPIPNMQGKLKKTSMPVAAAHEMSETKTKGYNRFGFAQIDRNTKVSQQPEVMLSNLQQKHIKREQEVRTANSTASNGMPRRHTTKATASTMNQLAAQQNIAPQSKISRKTSDVVPNQAAAVKAK